MAANQKLRVLCVDDNKLLCEALCSRAKRIEGLEWVGAIHDDQDLFHRIVEAKPDVVLMDIDMPGVDAFKLVEALASGAPQVRAVMLSGYVTPEYIARALDAGAWGYLSKNDDVGELVAGIRKVHEGGIAFSRDVELVSQRNRTPPNNAAH